MVLYHVRQQLDCYGTFGVIGSTVYESGVAVRYRHEKAMH